MEVGDKLAIVAARKRENSDEKRESEPTVYKQTYGKKSSS